jgi:hypothetical protein
MDTTKMPETEAARAGSSSNVETVRYYAPERLSETRAQYTRGTAQ